MIDRSHFRDVVCRPGYNWQVAFQRCGLQTSSNSYWRSVLRWFFLFNIIQSDVCCHGENASCCSLKWRRTIAHSYDNIGICNFCQHYIVCCDSFTSPQKFWTVTCLSATFIKLHVFAIPISALCVFIMAKMCVVSAAETVVVVGGGSDVNTWVLFPFR